MGVNMGRIKTTLIKRISNKLYSQNSDAFGKDFTKNKKQVESMINAPSKKIRNTIGGYVTRMAKTKE